ncbi:MAG: hypothetical protein H7831_09490 [Magnetococcus sp. WYHC-3]
MQHQFAQKAIALTTLLFATASTVSAQATTPATTSWKPAWLTEVSISIREGYDNNIYGSGVDSVYYPGSFTGPIDGSVTATKEHGSFFNSITPKVAIDLAKLLDKESILKTLAFGYAPEFVTYHDAPSENYIAHRLTSTIAAKCDNLSFLLDEAFTFIDGDKYAPTYPGGYYSVYGYAPLRERREQWQDRTTATLTYDQESWFMRATGSLLAYNLKTVQMAVPTANASYLNFVDRYDINGGVDFGYKIATNLAVTVGYRVGHQYQEELSNAIDPYDQTASSDYQRLLLGVEGSPVKWLKMKVQAGPDFRDYNDNAPVRDSNPIAFYGEGSLTATPSKDDTIALNCRRWRWIGSTGKAPADESSYELSYKRQINSQWSSKLGFRAQSADYSCGESWSAGNHAQATAPTNFRNDWAYVLSAGVQYDVSSSLSLDVAYAATMGRNAQDRADLAASQLPTSTRQFNNQVVSMGAKYKF